MGARARSLSLALLLLCLPLGTAPLEIATALACLVAAFFGAGRGWPLLGPVLLVGLSWALSALGHGPAAAWEALGRTWPLVPALALPRLVEAGELRPGRLGLLAAGGVGLSAFGQCLVAGVPPWVGPVSGPFSHHLTLGYALLPALAWALAGRSWLLAGAIGLGLVAAGSSGPALAAAVVVLALIWRPGPALGVGVVVSLVIIAVLAGDPELYQRAVLWTGGATVMLEHPGGVGPVGFREAVAAAQQRLEPGFFVPNHAHDAALQLGALAGPGAWIAWVVLLGAVWQRSGRAGRAGMAGLLVGALTQDTLGDLEVIRAMLVWALLPEPEAGYAVHPGGSPLAPTTKEPG